MRTIKFRAWDLYNKKMIELGDLETISLNKDLDFANYKIMQYTGLKDKNGNEIYEGDIVWYRLPHPDEKRHPNWHGCSKKIAVKWNEKTSGWNLKSGENREIIGNIYENKDLIGGEQLE